VLPRTVINTELSKQLVRSSCSVGANYTEANEALSKKDFVIRIKICLKEAKESAYWLKLVEASNPDFSEAQTPLLKESMELTKIFGSILLKSR